MTGILITFAFASFALLGWVFYGGYHIGAGVPMSNHILMALIATGFTVFSHSMIMMYLTATGRMIREAVQQGGLDEKYVRETKGYRNRIYRLATLAMVIVMAHTILGGGAHTKVFPVVVHHASAIFMILFSAYTTVMEVQLLIRNHLLGHHVAQLFELQRRT